MPSISQNWRRYFHVHNEGMGTTYERLILHRFFKRLKDRFDIRNILEAPSFGMTGISGINNMWWATQGIQVTVMDDDEERMKWIAEVWKDVSFPVQLVFQKDFSSLPFDDRLFDMSWNFAALRFLSDEKTFLKELTRVTKKVIFLCVPNSSNLFNMGRSQKKLNRIAPTIKRVMKEMKWHLLEQGYLDTPPWPDIAMSKEDMLTGLGLGMIARRMRKENRAGICILDYYTGKDPLMETRILKYDFMENLPNGMKKFWAHHQYFIYTSPNNAF